MKTVRLTDREYDVLLQHLEDAIEQLDAAAEDDWSDEQWNQRMAHLLRRLLKRIGEQA